MKVLSVMMSIVLVMSLVMGIYCAGTTKTYDFKKHLESISAIGQELPTLEQLGEIWQDMFFDLNTDEYAFVPNSSYLRSLTLKVQGDNGEVDTGILYPDLWSVSDWGIFDGINEFISGVFSVIQRTSLTFLWLGAYVKGFFQLVFAISPTSGLVERGAY